MIRGETARQWGGKLVTYLSDVHLPPPPPPTGRRRGGSTAVPARGRREALRQVRHWWHVPRHKSMQIRWRLSAETQLIWSHCLVEVLWYGWLRGAHVLLFRHCSHLMRLFQSRNKDKTRETNIKCARWSRWRFEHHATLINRSLFLSSPSSPPNALSNGLGKRGPSSMC